MSFDPAQLPEPRRERFDPAGVPLPALARRLAERVAASGGRALIVGGFVRDRLLGQQPGDIDLEVYGLAPERLEAVATEVASAKAVGKDFGILKVGHLDVSLPRADRHPGRQGYLKGDPSMSLAEASRRRDFTLNSMAWDPLNGAIYDPWGGLEDLRAGRLRHVAPDTFVEDPLRVLRAIQFIARFDLELDPGTVQLCRELAPILPDLPRERIFEEVKKLLLRGRRIGYALEQARQAGIVASLWPELEALYGCPQDVLWHPEGDVWIHTCMCLDVAATLRTGEEREDLALMLGVLCHDLGKPPTTVLCEDGHIRSHKHDTEGGPLTEAFLGRLTDDRWLVPQVVTLVTHHLRPAMLFQQHATDAAVRRLATKVNIRLLVRVARADHLGRTTPDALRGEFPAGAWLTAKAEELQVDSRPPPPIVQGRDLLPLGISAGPELGKLLKQLYEQQLEGEFQTLEQGLEAARRLFATRPG